MPSRCSGAKLRAQMDKARLTSAQLADKSGVSTSTISRILNDRAPNTNAFTLYALCDALGCSQYDLLSDDIMETAIREETDHAIANVVAEAVAEAVTVVNDETSPQVTPEQLAGAIPALPVSTPPVLDIASYVDYIKTSTASQVDAIRESRDTWRRTSVILFILLCLAVCYFIWEILHPDQGITSILWNIYTRTTPPTVAPTPPVT